MAKKIAGSLQLTALAAMSLSVGTAQADAIAGRFLGGDVTLNGLLRLETATKTTDKQNPYNQAGYLFNERDITLRPGNPVTGWQTQLQPDSAVPILPSVISSVSQLTGINNVAGLNLNGVLPNTVSNREGIKNQPASVNYHTVRIELSPTISWGNFSIISRLRALYDPGALGYSDWDARSLQGDRGGITGGLASLYQGKPNYFAYEVDGKSNPVPLEWSGRNYMVDFPALFAQYNAGSLTLRLGNQTIAWGQAIFFRVFDVANGIDFRRHLILGRALEEYADSRASALGFRATYQATDQIVADAFVQKFQPSILPNPNTPYNVIPSQFTIHDRYFQGGFDNKVNYGLRIKADYGKFSLQAMASERYQAEGVFRWTQSGLNKPLDNNNTLGLAFNTYCEAVLGSPAGQGCGPQLAQTPFEASPGAVHSAEEWFYYAHDVRLNGNEALNFAITDFPVTSQLLAVPVGDNVQAANNQLDAFFGAANGLHGHLERVYHKQQIYGLGGSYVIDAEPGSLLDQLIVNVEGSYTPNRSFLYSDVGLSQKIRVTSEFTGALVMEKYQRFSTDFPATYLVFQYLYRQKSDLVDRPLTGYGATPGSFPLPNDLNEPGQPKLPGGVNGAHYLVFAFLQPWPAYIYEVSAAALVDVRGGLLFQPAVQWKPRGDITFNLFYNYLNGDLGKNRNNNLVSTIDFADEIGVRIGYQF